MSGQASLNNRWIIPGADVSYLSEKFENAKVSLDPCYSKIKGEIVAYTRGITLLSKNICIDPKQMELELRDDDCVLRGPDFTITTKNKSVDPREIQAYFTQIKNFANCIEEIVPIKEAVTKLSRNQIKALRIVEEVENSINDIRDNMPMLHSDISVLQDDARQILQDLVPNDSDALFLRDGYPGNWKRQRTLSVAEGGLISLSNISDDPLSDETPEMRRTLRTTRNVFPLPTMTSIPLASSSSANTFQTMLCYACNNETMKYDSIVKIGTCSSCKGVLRISKD